MNNGWSDEKGVRMAIEVARQAAEQGNNPFGAVLVSSIGRVLGEAGNSQARDGQVLAHAEMNLLHRAVREHDAGTLRASTLYTSAEPCVMCCGALFWSRVGRLVFGLSTQRLHAITEPTARRLPVGAHELLARGGYDIEVIGPLLEDEAATLFR